MSEYREKGGPKWVTPFASNGFFWTTIPRPCTKLVQGGAGPPKIIVCSSKSDQKVTTKLIHLSSLCSLRNICGELGDSNLAPSFARCVLPFPLQTQRKNHPHALSAHS